MEMVLKEPHAIALDRQDRLFVADRNNARVVIFDKGGKFIAAWKQFGRPSGLWVDQEDILYTVDSQSSNDPKSPNYNGDCKMGIRVGSVKDGKVTAYIPPPPVSDPKLQPPEGITVDSHGAIYAPRSNRATSRSTSRINSAALRLMNEPPRPLLVMEPVFGCVEKRKLEKHEQRPASKTLLAAIADSNSPPDLTITGLARALPYSWAEQELNAAAGTPCGRRHRRHRHCPSRQPQYRTPKCRLPRH